MIDIAQNGKGGKARSGKADLRRAGTSQMLCGVIMLQQRGEMYTLSKEDK
jgi:hypothetical protein